MHVTDVLPRDAIPSIDTPRFDVQYPGDTSDDAIVVPGSPSKAYPVRILSYHEIANDTIDDQPIAVTWCPICWSALVFDRVVDDRELTFGVSGKLADDALVLYDRETGSEWKQPTGEAIAGPLSGTKLTVRPTMVQSIEEFRSAHPDGIVLQPDRDVSVAGFPSTYDMNPYRRYVEGDLFGLRGMRGTGRRRGWERDDIDAKTIVLGIKRAGIAVGFPHPWVRTVGGVLTHTVADLDIVVFATDEQLSGFVNPGYEFVMVDDQVRGDGTTWHPRTGIAADGRRLEPLPTRRMFAFAWVDAFGSDSLLCPGNEPTT